MHGRALRRRRAMSGYAGSHPPRRTRPAAAAYKSVSTRCGKVCADRAVGPDAPIADVRRAAHGGCGSLGRARRHRRTGPNGDGWHRHYSSPSPELSSIVRRRFRRARSGARTASAEPNSRRLLGSGTLDPELPLDNHGEINRGGDSRRPHDRQRVRKGGVGIGLHRDGGGFPQGLSTVYRRQID
jgi:hypothetical protein